MNGAGQNELAATLERFVHWTRQQGWRYQMVPVHLRHFEHFLVGRGVAQLADVNVALLSEYRRCLLVQRGAATVNGYMSTLRALWRYLLKEELVTEDATRNPTHLRPDEFIPHLYSAHELLQIERGARAAIARADGPVQRFCRRTQHAAFCLLRDCGLRVSEVCRLNLNDYDPQARTLRIDNTKFFKTRHIPLPRSTCTVLGQYLKHRPIVVADKGESSAFFVSKNACRLNRGTFEANFTRLLRELGIYQPRRRHGRTVSGSTNLHALRHSYAVRTLERWQRERCDVERLLPLLSGYLGHAHVSYTKHYLHLTPALRQLASERFAQRVLPRLDHNGALTDDE